MRVSVNVEGWWSSCLDVSLGVKRATCLKWQEMCTKHDCLAFSKRCCTGEKAVGRRVEGGGKARLLL